jgi:hypothetical protein
MFSGTARHIHYVTSSTNDITVASLVVHLTVYIKDRVFSSDGRELLRKHDALVCNSEYTRTVRKKIVVEINIAEMIL